MAVRAGADRMACRFCSPRCVAAAFARSTAPWSPRVCAQSVGTRLSFPRQVSRIRVLEAERLTKVYRMGEVDVHALRGIDLELYEAEFIVLLGASGSGKSTLLNILGGLDVPTTGSVFYRGQDL